MKDRGLPTLLALIAAAACGAAENTASNAQCLVCHGDLRREAIAADHLDAAVTCVACHGESVEHIQDEMQMTTPDRLFGRKEVEAACSGCHAGAGGIYRRSDHKDPNSVKAFYDKWLGKVRPNGRAITADSICTDCHGRHNVGAVTAEAEDKAENKQWTPLFDGRSLSGWKASGRGRFNAERRGLTAEPAGAKGFLLTDRDYGDFRLAVTFRASGPVKAAVCIRSDAEGKGPRVTIAGGDKQTAPAGSVLLPDKGLVLSNTNDVLLDAGGWNTLSIEARGKELAVWLNGTRIGLVAAEMPEAGRIGIALEKAKAGSLLVREILLCELSDKSGESD
jgi:hypothetical protein